MGVFPETRRASLEVKATVKPVSVSDFRRWLPKDIPKLPIFKREPAPLLQILNLSMLRLGWG